MYLKDYQTPAEGRLGLGRYFGFYNHQRPHQSLGYRTPAEVYELVAAAKEAAEPVGGARSPPKNARILV